VTRRPRLLFISSRFLFPANEGGKIRTSNILRQMKGGAFELMLASPAPADVSDFVQDIRGVCDRFRLWPARSRSRMRRVLALAAPVPVSVATDQSRAGRAAIARAIVERPDVVVIDFPHTTVLVPKRIDFASVIFTHNVEVEIFERHAELTGGLWHLIWRDQTRKMQAFEQAALRRVDSVISVSSRDADALRRRYGLSVVEQIDTGVDLDFFQFMVPAARSDGGTIVFIGAMDSPANIDGITFLMNEIWPLVARARPGARAVIVGRQRPEPLVATVRDRRLAWTFTGLVDDIRPYAAAAHISVIPLRIGSGTRIKAFEAMAMGRPVVSTRVGVEGLDIESGRHFLAADDPNEFAAAILRLLDDAALCETLASQARARLVERFSWAHVARQFEAICLRALRRKSGSYSSRQGEEAEQDIGEAS
jgi:glycosyltransferase involved in cell wall biosynthesis